MPRRPAQPRIPPVERRLLTVEEVQGYTGWSLSFIYRLLNDGLLPLVRIRRAVRIDRQDLDELIARSKVIAGAEQRVADTDARSSPSDPSDPDGEARR